MRRLTMRPAAAAALLLAATLLAACGGNTATPAPATATPNDTTAPVPTLPSLPSGLSSFSLPSFTADKELEALFPASVGGLPVRKFSMTGDSFLLTGAEGSEELLDALEAFDKEPGDLSVVLGGTDAIGLFAYRIRGVPAPDFFGAFVAGDAGEGAVITDVTFGGKAVKKVVTSGGETVYLYASGDVLFGAGGDNVTDALLTETFSLLP